MAQVPALANQFAAAKGRALVVAQGRLVAVAKAANDAVMRRDPRPYGVTRFVDGRQGVAETAVKAFGTIVYIYHRNQIGLEVDEKQTAVRLDHVAQFALATLRSLSPVRSGLYRDSHRLFRNGYPVSDLLSWKADDEISIANTVPYSRILEVGDGKFRIPHLVYDQAADIVAGKFGDDAAITFDWRGLTDGMQIAQDPSQRRGFGTRIAGRSRAHNASDVRFPTLIITPKASRASFVGNLSQAARIAYDGYQAFNAVRDIGASAQQLLPAPSNAPLGITFHNSSGE